MDLIHPTCAGLDVHQKTVVACARIVAEGTVTQEVRTFGTTTRQLLTLADWLAARGHSCGDGIHGRLLETGLARPRDVVRARPRQRDAHSERPRRKSDINDATWIADLLAHGLIRGSFVPSAPIHELRDLTRTRQQLVREIAQHTLRLQKILEDANLKLTTVVSDILGVSGRAILVALIGSAK
jgi:transposase